MSFRFLQGIAAHFLSDIVDDKVLLLDSIEELPRIWHRADGQPASDTSTPLRVNVLPGIGKLGSAICVSWQTFAVSKLTATDRSSLQVRPWQLISKYQAYPMKTWLRGW